MGAAANIDQYISLSPVSARPVLAMLRATIQAAAPAATEDISYALPTFRVDGHQLVGFAAWKQHLSLYPMSYAVIEAFQDDLSVHEVQKGTVRFTVERPLAPDLVARIVRARLAELEAPPG